MQTVATHQLDQFDYTTSELQKQIYSVDFERLDFIISFETKSLDNDMTMKLLDKIKLDNNEIENEDYEFETKIKLLISSNNFKSNKIEKLNGTENDLNSDIYLLKLVYQEIYLEIAED